MNINCIGIGFQWQDLRSMTRERSSQTESSRGEIINDWSNQQQFQGTIQPRIRPRGMLQKSSEGIREESNYLLFCNMICSSLDTTPVDIQYLDIVVDSINGQRYRIEANMLGAGLPDHYEIPIELIETAVETDADA